jgi:hypothetical protein
MLSGLSTYAAVRDGYVASPNIGRVKLLDGRSLWQAVCPVPLTIFAPGGVYANVAVGADTCKVVAARKAVSEALERSAYAAVRQSEEREDYGFGVCHDTTGMAAMPRLTFGAAAMARSNAQLEALERWAIDHWWLGKLPAVRRNPVGPVQVLSIRLPRSICGYGKSAVLICWSDSESGRSYGFGAGPSESRALESAITELSRNHWALIGFRTTKSSDCSGQLSAQLSVQLSVQERRLLYFASGQGRQAFDQRAHASFRLCENALNIAPPRLLVDAEIRGPWSRYGVVWRCLFEETLWMSAKNQCAFAF